MARAIWNCPACEALWENIRSVARKLSSVDNSIQGTSVQNTEGHVHFVLPSCDTLACKRKMRCLEGSTFGFDQVSQAHFQDCASSCALSIFRSLDSDCNIRKEYTNSIKEATTHLEHQLSDAIHVPQDDRILRVTHNISFADMRTSVVFTEFLPTFLPKFFVMSYQTEVFLLLSSPSSPTG